MRRWQWQDLSNRGESDLNVVVLNMEKIDHIKGNRNTIELTEFAAACYSNLALPDVARLRSP